MYKCIFWLAFAVVAQLNTLKRRNNEAILSVLQAAESGKRIFGSRPCLEERHACPECGLSFTRSGNLRRHQKMIHQHQYPFKCNICGKGMAGRLDLEGHMNTQHGGNKKFKCQICKKEYGYKHHYFHHIRSAHMQDEWNSTNAPEFE